MARGLINNKLRKRFPGYICRFDGSVIWDSLTYVPFGSKGVAFWKDRCLFVAIAVYYLKCGLRRNWWNNDVSDRVLTSICDLPKVDHYSFFVLPLGHRLLVNVFGPPTIERLGQAFKRRKGIVCFVLIWRVCRDSPVSWLCKDVVKLICNLVAEK